MNNRLFLGFSIFLFFINTSYADYSFRLNDPSGCNAISGKWSGKGKATNWLLGSCVYHGTGTVSAVDSAGNFTAQVTADKDSGSGLCPNHATEQLKAVCVNGIVTIKTEFGSLRGNFSATKGTASGTLSVSPGLDAEISIQFFR